MINAGTVGAYLELDITQFKNNLLIAGNMLRLFRKEQESTFNDTGSPGKTLLGALSAPIAAAGKAAAEFAGGFGRAMSIVREDSLLTGSVIGGMGTGFHKVSDSADEMCSGIISVMGKVPEKAKSVIQSSCSGMRNELSSAGPALSTAAAKDGNAIVGAFDRTVGSGRLMTIGNGAVSSLSKGISSQKPTAYSAINGIMRGMLSAAGKVSFTGIGSGVISGIAKGLNAGRSGLVATAVSIASGIAAKMKAVLKISSPSRVTQEIGFYTARGMEIGLKQGSRSLYETASAISLETAETLGGISSRRMNLSGGQYGGYKSKSDRLDKILDAVEKLADSQTTMEIDGRSFGRLVREYA